MMLNKQYSMLIIVFFLLNSFSSQAFYPTLSTAFPPKNKQKIITIKLNNAPAVRNVFLPLFKQFEQETGIKVIPLHYIHDAEFKEFIKRSFNGKAPLPDVLNGLASEPIYSIIRQDLVHPITHLWKQHNWQANVPKKITDWVTYNNEIYALPYTKYPWGLFYKKSFLQRFGVPPNQWDNFLEYCDNIKKAGIDLFPSTEKQPWIAAAWFEYLILRMHGIELFNNITQGTVSFHDKSIQGVLFEWKKLIDKGYFNSTYKNYTWEEQLPHFLRNKFAFMFMGSRLARRIYDPAVLADIQFIPFPKINNIPRYESSPASLFFISKQSMNKADAEKLLVFIAKPEVQSVIAKKLFSVPVHSNTQIPDNPMSLNSYNILASAKDVSPFYDRAINEGFSKVSLGAFEMFIRSGNIQALTETLEDARLRYFP